MRAVAVAALWLAACGPSETAVTRDTFRVEPELDPGCISVSRVRLQLEAAPGQSDGDTVRVQNVCEGFLELRSIELESGDPFAVERPEDLTLEASVSVDVGVRFEPLLAGDYDDRLLIRSNDEDLPVAEVQLDGTSAE